MKAETPNLNMEDARSKRSNPRLSLNQTEAAASLGVSEKTLQRWAKEGILVPVKFGKRVTLYPIAMIEEFLRRHLEAQKVG